MDMNLKPILRGSLLILFSCSSVFLLNSQVVHAFPYTDIDVHIAFDMITNGSFPDLLILDVRTQSEYNEGHLSGAVWIPHTELKARIGELAGHESHEIVVYCRSGVRSLNASSTLDSFNFTEVYNMLGGILAWENATYPIMVSTVHNLDTTFSYDTIQAALDAPQTLDGHTILVEKGVYPEHVVVNKSLHLIGESRNGTVIDGEYNGTHHEGVVVLIQADNVLLSNFTVRGSGCCGAAGIYVDNCGNVTVTHNNIMWNNGFGVKLENTSRVTLSYNNNGNNVVYAIQLANSSDNVILGNFIKNQSNIAVSLRYSHNNSIIENNISNSTVGITFEYSDHNLLSRNNLFDNLFQVQSVFSANMFDNELEGNYWDDYGGSDSDYNGIGDTAHGLPDSNEDRYPLMGIFHSFNTSLGEHVNVISDSTIEDFEYYEANSTIKMHVSNMTGSQIQGFVRITIPHTLMTEPYNITVDGVDPTFWNYTLHDNGTHRWIYFTYDHSTREVIIIPESLSLIALLLIMTVTLLIALTRTRPKEEC